MSTNGRQRIRCSSFLVVLATALLLVLPSPARAADFAGRWVGELRMEYSNGSVQRQPVFMVLRQFGNVLEGTFGYHEDIQSRLTRASADGESLRLAAGRVVMELRLRSGDRLEGEVTFPGAGAPETFASFRRVVRGNMGVAGPERPSVAGDVRTIENFRIPQLGRTRRVLVYLPPGYEGGATRYPVIYMADGQNLFDVMTSDRGEWGIDETLERLYRERRTDGVIVVGVEHGRELRSLEYMPRSLGVVPGGEGEKYAEFVAKTLKPYIDSHYRTLAGREHAAVVGASAGAQIAFFIGTEYPEVFSKIGALGFVMGRGAKEQIARWRATHRKHPGMRIYLHAGTEENLGGPAENRLFVDNLKLQYEALRALGYGDSEVMLDIEEGAHHVEAFWSRRFERLFEWLMASCWGGRKLPCAPSAE